MNRYKRWGAIGIVVSIATMLISMIGASLVQSSGGSVQVKDLTWLTSTGQAQAGTLFVPPGVSPDQKVPGIVVSHGMFNRREMQDANFVELSRRGYVVLSMDMLSHGDSDAVPNIGLLMGGAYEAVKELATLPYVDTTKIGITGHSLGGMSINAAVAADDAAQTHLISAVLFTEADATYKDQATGAYTDIFGSRDAGIIAGRYDEFFMRDVDAAGNVTPARDFIKYGNAQSFLHFGEDPKDLDARDANTEYSQSVDGKDVFRVVYTPTVIHPWAFFSTSATKDTIEFFDSAFEAPTQIAASNQVWPIKEFFNAVGLVGFAMFLVALGTLLLWTPYFAPLRAEEPVRIRDVSRTGRVWFWGMGAVTAAFSAVIFVPLMTHIKSFTVSRDPWGQSQSYALGMWSIIVAGFVLLTLAAYYFLHGRTHGFSLRETGVAISWRALGRTVVLALALVAATYTWVFAAHYFFHTDFRLWLLGLPEFSSSVIVGSLFPYLPMFLLYYVVLSIATNSFNFVKIGRSSSTREWTNTAVVAALNVLPVVALLVIQFSYLAVKGLPLWDAAAMHIDWTWPFLVVIPGATVITRKLYRVTNNPYLPGIAMGVIATLLVCSNSLTWA